MSTTGTVRKPEERVFEDPHHWERQRVHGDEIGRVDYTASLIPEGVSDLLDLGCGGGLFLNRLEKFRQQQLRSVHRAARMRRQQMQYHSLRMVWIRFLMVWMRMTMLMKPPSCVWQGQKCSEVAYTSMAAPLGKKKASKLSSRISVVICFQNCNLAL